MVLTPAQAQIAEDTHRFRVLRCGRRFGKTLLAAWEIFGVAVSAPNKRISYYAPTRDDARDIMWGTLCDICLPVITYKNDSRLELKVKTKSGGESLIVLQGWESVKDRQKGRGVKNDFIVTDEVSKYPEFWLNWHEVLRPTLTDTRGSALFPSTPNGYNHFYDLSNIELRDPDFKTFHFSTYDNPYIPLDEIEKARKELPEDKFSQEYLAEFRKKSGLVYPEFSRAIHLFDDLTPRRGLIEVISGVDFGFTNPSVILVIERDSDNNYWVRSEWYRTGKTNAELIEYARTLGVNAFYPDPAEPDRIEEMKRAGLTIREVNKDIVKGIDSVRTLLKNKKLRVHLDCLNLISELETYSYPEKRTNQNEPEVPIKEGDHACDALRYALFMNAPIVSKDETEFSLYEGSYR